MIRALQRIATALERIADLKELELTQHSDMQSEEKITQGLSRLSIERELRDT